MAESLEDKLVYFQAITGLDDPDLCTEILSAHNWDLDLAISGFTSSPTNPSPNSSFSVPAAGGSGPNLTESSLARHDSGDPAPPGLAWKLITLPFYVVSGGVGLITGAVGLGVWIAGGIISRSLNLLGLATSRGPEADRLVPLPASAAEAADFVAAFERDFGGAGSGVRFAAEGFMDALQRSQREYKLLFVYLHSPDHPDVPAFCSGCLCSASVAAFVNENFVAWGGSIRRTEGFNMSNSLKASRFPFCAVVVPSTNQRIVLLQQARERQRKEEQERLEREAAEAERKHKEEEETRDRAAREAAEKEAALARRRQEKAMSLGVEPEKGPDVTHVLIRFPSGERKERKFHSSAMISSLYDHVDSLDCLKVEKYTLVSNFPRISYGPEKHSLTLKEAGLHPQASLFVEVDS
ncbi:Plant UBX domain-containing protein 10 [Cocos nucifera]|uniref:Plant UBX domain-containing protein 10 n=1 Tax=Cocos nucifera TaxID=13894 RepID=A0A8K0IEU3_COCNU|nr:Plant UBX domain-containing protein 10 [Cocos nucifera]